MDIVFDQSFAGIRVENIQGWVAIGSNACLSVGTEHKEQLGDLRIKHVQRIGVNLNFVPTAVVELRQCSRVMDTTGLGSSGSLRAKVHGAEKGRAFVHQTRRVQIVAMCASRIVPAELKSHALD